MLPLTHRVSTRTIHRLFARPNTRKIVAYPFIFFVSPIRATSMSLLKLRPQNKSQSQSQSQSDRPHIQRAIQIPTKISKSSVKRHVIKRVFYDVIRENYNRIGSSTLPMNHHANHHMTQTYAVVAVPQKNRIDDASQLLASGDKTRIVQSVRAWCTSSLSVLLKKRGSSVESNVPSRPSINVKKP